MNLKTEPRKDFYANELNMERMNEILNISISHLTLQELLKLIREVAYDMVRYDSEEICGIVYSGKNGDYQKINQEQACFLQRHLRSMCDLFGQSVIQKHIFDQGYLKRYNLHGELNSEISGLEKENRRLEGVISDLRYEINE